MQIYYHKSRPFLLYMCSKWLDPDSKVHGANMGPIWGQQDPDGPHVGAMSFAMWGVTLDIFAVFC